MGSSAADLRAERRFSRGAAPRVQSSQPPGRPLPGTRSLHPRRAGSSPEVLGGLHPARSFPSPAARLASPLSQRAAAARRLPGRRGLRSREATPQGDCGRAAPGPRFHNPPGCRGRLPVPRRLPRSPRAVPSPPSPPGAPQSAQRPLPAAFSSSSSGTLGRSRSIGAGPGREMRKRSGAPSRGALPALLSPFPALPSGRLQQRLRAPGQGGAGCGLGAARTRGGSPLRAARSWGPAAGRRAHPCTCCSSSASLQAWLSSAGSISNAKAAVQQSGGWDAGSGRSARTAGRLGQGLGTTPGSCLCPAARRNRWLQLRSQGKQHCRICKA